MLPSELEPQVTAPLVRLGSEHDGGYLVEVSSLERSDALLSAGLGANWDFERDYAQRTGHAVHAYDHTLTERLLWKLKIRAVLDVIRGRAGLRELRRAAIRRFDYQRVFRDRVVHFRRKIGYSANGDVPMGVAIERCAAAGALLVKIDVEGDEYRLLDELAANQDCIAGLVIELHDCDVHRSRIVDFVRAFSLQLVHIHGNNYAGIDAAGDPLCLELTFSAMPPTESRNGAFSRSPLDRPNDPARSDVHLRFAPSP